MTQPEEKFEAFLHEKRVIHPTADTKARTYIKDYDAAYQKSIADPEAFWGAVHKSITGITALPIEFRRKSKAWLDERGWKALGDGDL